MRTKLEIQTEMAGHFAQLRKNVDEVAQIARLNLPGARGHSRAAAASLGELEPTHREELGSVEDIPEERLPETEYPTAEDAGISTLETDTSDPINVPEPDENIHTEDGHSRALRSRVHGYGRRGESGNPLDSPAPTKTGKHVGGRPRIDSGVAGLRTRTSVEDKHITEYVRHQILEWVAALGGTEALRPEQDMLIAVVGANLEMILRIQSAIAKDPSMMQADYTTKMTTLIGTFQKSLKMLGLNASGNRKPSKKERATSIQDMLAAVKSQKKSRGRA